MPCHAMRCVCSSANANGCHCVRRWSAWLVVTTVSRCACKEAAHRSFQLLCNRRPHSCASTSTGWILDTLTFYTYICIEMCATNDEYMVHHFIYRRNCVSSFVQQPAVGPTNIHNGAYGKTNTKPFAHARCVCHIALGAAVNSAILNAMSPKRGMSWRESARVWGTENGRWVEAR